MKPFSKSWGDVAVRNTSYAEFEKALTDVLTADPRDLTDLFEILHRARRSVDRNSSGYQAAIDRAIAAKDQLLERLLTARGAA